MLWEVAQLLYPDSLGHDTAQMVASPRLEGLLEEPLQISEAASLIPPDRLGDNTSPNARTNSCPPSPNAPVVGARCLSGVLAAACNTTAAKLNSRMR